jgi:phospholipid-binding lipoprotein MlaA
VIITACPRGALRCAVGLLLAAMLAACATPPSDPAERLVFEQTNDPLEPLNRYTLDFNLFLDRILLRPVTEIYIAIVPEEGRNALRRALRNMKEPVVAINNVLQGELERAGVSLGRFAVNTTMGLAGLVDVAVVLGLERETGDFGQTLFVWGLPEGPYLVLPVLGPSNPRDAIGMGADSYIDPFGYLASTKGLGNVQIARFLVDGIDQRAQVLDVLDALQRSSLDFYAQLRSLVQQRRAAELRRGAIQAPEPGFYDDPDGEPLPAASSPAPPELPPPEILPASASAGP